VPGPAGPAGNTVLYGSTNPVAATGVDGNFYINTSINSIFGPKAGGAWPAGASMIGPQGATGAQGNAGVDGNTILYGAADPTAGQGVPGDFYINTTTHYLFGPKAAVTGGGGSTTLNPGDKEPHISLSGGNLTATGTAGWTGSVRAVDGQSSGKYYWECTLNGAAVQSGVGVSINALPIATVFGGTGTGQAGLAQSGVVFVDGSSFGLTIGGVGGSTLSFGTIPSGTVICAAIDVPNKLMWWRLGAAGNWNNNSSRNPATGAGGVSIPNIPTAYPSISFGGADTVIANFGASTFIGAVPSGFTAGWGTASTGGWPAGTSLVGPQGPQGIQGIQGIQGPAGAGSPSTVPPLMDGAAAIGSSTNFARQDHIHPSDTSRLIKAGDIMGGPLILAADPTVALGAATKQYADAHATYPFLSINGGMAISQERGFGTGLVCQNAAGYTHDGFLAVAQGAPTITGYPTTTTLPGFVNQFAVTILTPYVSTLAAADAAYVYQPIEGLRIARLAWGTANAQPVSIGFWAWCALAGSITLGVINGANNRTYLFDVVINTANAWQWCSVTVPGDVTGTWTTDASIGLYLSFCFACGSNFRGVAGWQAGNFRGSAATMNLCAAANSLVLTGLIVVPGTIVPPSSIVPFLLPTYDQELAACQRYYEAWPLTTAYTPIATGQANNASNAQIMTLFKTRKRAAPTFAISAPGDFVMSNAAGGLIACTGLALGGSDLGSAYLLPSVASGLVAGNSVTLYRNGTNAAKLAFDARL
jgi:hypothetical protein